MILHSRIRNKQLIESLEPRRLLAAVSWDGGGDGTSWKDPSNWSNDLVPGQLDDVTINVANNPIILIADVDQSIKSLAASETLMLTCDLTISASATLDAPISISANRALKVQSGLTLNAPLTLGSTVDNSAGELLFFGDLNQLLDGSGSIQNVGSASSGVVNITEIGHTQVGKNLTIASTISITLNGRGEIGATYGSIDSSATIEFIGTGTTALGQSSIFGQMGFTNNGTITISNDVRMRALNLVNNAGKTISVTDSEFALTEDLFPNDTYSWDNNGSFVFSNADVMLEGQFNFSDLGTFSRTGGEFKIAGVFDNTAQTLILDDHTGSWDLFNDGVILNGSVNSVGQNQLRPRGGTLDGVTLNTAMTFDTTQGITVVNGLVLNSILTIDPSSQPDSPSILFKGSSMAVTGNGEINFETTLPAYLSNDCIGDLNGLSLRFGSGITLSFAEKTNFGGTVETGRNVQLDGVLNIRGDSGAGTSSITLGREQSLFINNGAINISHAARVNSFGLINNAGHTLSIINSIVYLGGPTQSTTYSWHNAGQIIAESYSRVYLRGFFKTADIGVWQRDFSTEMYLSGKLDNSNASLDVSESLGELIVTISGRIINGLVTSTIPEQLLFRDGTLDGVTLNTEAQVETASRLYVEHGLTLNSIIRIGTASGTSVLEFRGVGAQTLGGTGTIIGLPGVNSRILNTTRVASTGTAGETLTIGEGIVMNLTEKGEIISQTSNSNGVLINNGTINISGQIENAMFNFNSNGGMTVYNNGAIHISGGAQLDMKRLEGNMNTITASGANTEVHIRGGYTINGLASVSDNAWMYISGDWTLTTGMNISATALFHHYDIDMDDYPTYETIKAAVISGYAGGAWNGVGLRDSVAAGNERFGLGFAKPSDAELSELGNFHGMQLHSSQVIVRHTLDADFNLDDNVDFQDLLRVAQNYDGTNHEYANGDTNLDGAVNFTDLLRTAQLYNQSAFSRIPIRPIKSTNEMSHRSVL